MTERQEKALDAAIRDARALRLYLRGMSYREIAADRGYRNPGEAYEAVHRAIRARARATAMAAPVTLDRVNAEIERLRRELGELGGDEPAS